MVLPPSRASAGMRSIRRELERRRAKPQAPKHPAALKPSAPPPPPPASREGAHRKVRKTCARPVCEDPSSVISTMAQSDSSSTNPPPPKRPRLHATPREVSDLPPPPSRYVSFPVRSASVSVPGAAALLESTRRSPPRTLSAAPAASMQPPSKRRRLQDPPRASMEVSRLSSPTSSYVSSSVGSAPVSVLDAAAHRKPTRRSPSHPPSAAPAPQPPPPPTGSSSARSASAATPSSAGLVKPGTRAAVRTRSQATVNGRTIVLWLPARVISASNGSYEVIYEGKLPRENPFSTVDVPLHHVKLIKPPQTTLPPPPPSQLVSAAAASSASKDLETQLPPRPTRAGKSIRLFSSQPPQTQHAPRPTTAGKSISFIRELPAETKLEASSKADHGREEHQCHPNDVVTEGSPGPGC